MTTEPISDARRLQIQRKLIQGLLYTYSDGCEAHEIIRHSTQLMIEAVATTWPNDPLSPDECQDILDQVSSSLTNRFAAKAD